jgi:hypothetical protein
MSNIISSKTNNYRTVNHEQLNIIYERTRMEKYEEKVHRKERWKI